jgi:hypothetical protein
MTDALASHLWQSTIFAGAAALLTLAFRVNRAQVRYWLWIGASLKFLIPFALLTSVGSYIQTWAPPIHEIAVCNAGSVLRDGIFQPALVTAKRTAGTRGSVEGTLDRSGHSRRVAVRPHSPYGDAASSFCRAFSLRIVFSSS